LPSGASFSLLHLEVVAVVLRIHYHVVPVVEVLELIHLS
jgi:hypothetical protein